MSHTNFDPISVVEAAYDTDAAGDDWLATVTETAATFFPGRSRMMSLVVDADSTPQIRRLYSEGSEERELRDMSDFLRALDELPEDFNRIYMERGTSLNAVSSILGQKPSEHPEFSRFAPDDVRDYVGIMAHVPSGHSIQIGAVMPSATQVDEAWKPVWDQITAHVANAFRLRERNDALEPDTADAVVDPSGEVRHLGSEREKKGDVRDALREAATGIERARTDLRDDDPRRALDLWKGLVSGYYSLVDYFDTDGRRFYVARRNDPDVHEPESLSLRERQVVALAALGYTHQRTAYALGLSPSTIATYFGRARKKMGVDSRIELIRLFRSLTAPD